MQRAEDPPTDLLEDLDNVRIAGWLDLFMSMDTTLPLPHRLEHDLTALRHLFSLRYVN